MFRYTLGYAQEKLLLHPKWVRGRGTKIKNIGLPNVIGFLHLKHHSSHQEHPLRHENNILWMWRPVWCPFNAGSSSGTVKQRLYEHNIQLPLRLRLCTSNTKTGLVFSLVNTGTRLGILTMYAVIVV